MPYVLIMEKRNPLVDFWFMHVLHWGTSSLVSITPAKEHEFAAHGLLDEQLLQRAVDSIGSHLSSHTILRKTPAILAYHRDGDGCCAAYFLKKYSGLSSGNEKGRGKTHHGRSPSRRSCLYR